MLTRKRTTAVLAITLTTAVVIAAPLTPAPTQAQGSPIKHVVILYLENHSFDSLLGWWCDDSPGRCPDGGMPSSVTLSDGTVVTPSSTMPDVVPTVDHSVAAQMRAIDGGKMDGWQKVSGCGAPGYACVGGYTPAQVPNLAALATQFAISDDMFSPADAPSWGGHLDMVLATTDGFLGANPGHTPGLKTGPGWGCDSNRQSLWAGLSGSETPVLAEEPSCVPYYGAGLANGGAYRRTPVPQATSIMQELQGAGLSWRIYGEPTPSLQSQGNTGYIWDTCPSIAWCLDQPAEEADNVQASQFTTDALAGNLPSFSLITPGGSEVAGSEHNGFSMTAGDNWLGQVASAVMNGPDWSSTALFITWDDCGCFYDQVPPPLAPDGRQEGPRLPLVIVSPYAKPGFTDTTQTTTAGILAYVEQTFGVAPLTVNDAVAYPFTNAFNYAQVPQRPVRMVTRPVPRGDRIKWWEARQDT